MTLQTASEIDTLRIDGARLWKSLMDLAKIGATPKGGVCRLTLTDLDQQGRDLVLSWAREAGMSVVIDRIGNGFMRRAGRNNTLPPIVTGFFPALICAALLWKFWRAAADRPAVRLMSRARAR